MSETIDNRVVEMRFDNQQFESGVQTSLSTLEKLKQSLNLSGAAKGLDEVSNSAKGLDFSHLSGAVDTVRERFSALQIMGVTALANIANSAVNAGKQLVESLTIAPIKQGFDEYELKMGAVQTIMASSGASLKEVNGYLQELNTYSDKTIYSFSDMTQSIGKFTNAGVGLDDAVKAIQGISNEAAVSGANANEASRAMYNFAQALSAGSVKLIDWKSIENANMATVEFKQSLLDTALAMGTVKKEGDKYVTTTKDANGKTSEAFDATKNFNDSLAHQWMTTDVLIQTLGNYSTDVREMTKDEKKAYEEKLKSIGYTDEQIKSIEKLGQKAFDSAQDVKTYHQLIDTLQEAVGSGWATTFELIFGDLEESKKLWTGVSNVIGGFINQTSNARNAMLQEWKDLGGRAAVIDGLKNAFDGLVSVLKPVSQAFREVFPPITGKQLFALSKGFKEFTSHLTLSKTASENLKRTFKGLFSIIDIGKNIFLTAFRIATSLFSLFSGAGDGILSITAIWGDWLVSLDQMVKKGTGVADIIQNIVDAIKAFFGSIGEKINFSGFALLDSILERISQRISDLKKSFSDAKSGASDFFSIFSGIGGVISKVAEGMGTLIANVIDKIGNADFSKFFDFINLLSMGGIGVGLFKVLGKFKDVGGNSGIGGFLGSLLTPLRSFGDIGKGVVDILDGVKGCLEAYQTQLKAGALIKIAAAIAILAASVTIISLIDSKKLAASLAAITAMFADLMVSMAVFSNVSGSMKNTAKAISAIIGLSVAVLIMATALKTVGSLEPAKLAAGMAGIVGLTATIVTAAKILGNSGKKAIKGAGQMVLFAVAIKILASACKQMSTMSMEELGKGLLGVGALMTAVSAFLRTAKFSGKAISTAIGIAILAGAINILTMSCKTFSQMNADEIKKGLGSIGGLLLEIALFTRASGDAKGMLSTGIAMIAIANAMKIFASVMQDMSKLSGSELTKGLIGVSVALLAVAGATKLMPNNMVVIGVGLLAVSNALVTMATALHMFSGMSWEEIAKGLVAFGGSLGILAVGLRLMNGTLAGSAALLVAVAALNLLTPVLSTLGGMSWESIAKGLVAIAGAFAILGIAGAVLAPVTPAILALSGAIALLGIGFAAIGVGLLAAGAGLSAIAVGFTALATAVGAGAAAITAGLTIIITGIAALIPMIATKIGEGIVAFCAAIAAGATSIAASVVTVVNAIVVALAQTIPTVVNTLFSLLATLLDALKQYTPTLVQTGCDIIIAFLDGVAANISQIVQAGIDVVLGFIDGITQKLPDIIQAGFDLLIGFIDGLTRAIDENIPRLVESMKNLILTAINAAIVVLTGGIVNFKAMGQKLMDGGLIKGLKEKASNFGKSVKETVTNGIKAIRSKFSEWTTKGKETITKFIEGVRNKGKSLGTEAKKLVTDALNTVKRKFNEWKNAGKNIIGKFIDGIKSKFGAVRQAALGLINRAKSALDGGKDRAKSAGEDFGNGFKSGISAVAGGVADAARSMVERAVAAAKSAQDSNSPSKVTRALGHFFGSGYILGVQDMKGKLVNTTKTVFGKVIDVTAGIVNKGQEVLSGLSESMLASMDDISPSVKSVASIANAVSNALNMIPVDASPTIRPVLDLSNVESGVGAMNSLFSSQYMIPALANIEGISSTMSNRREVGNDGIVDAIKSLRREIKQVGGNTTHIGDVTYDDGSNVSKAARELVRAVKMERRG